MTKKMKKKIKRNIRISCRNFSFYLLNYFFIIFCKLKPNRVLFLSDVRDVLDGNLKFLYDVVAEEEYEKIVLLKADRRYKRSFSEKFKLVYFLSTSKYILLDDYSKGISLMKVRKNQEVCQLWHGAGAFKKFGYSRSDQKRRRKEDGHKNYTKAIVTSKEIKWCYSEAFGIDEDNVYVTGFPRTDVFFQQQYIENKQKELYEEYPFLKEKKVILFAPTYRGNSLKRAYYDFEQLDLEKIYNELHKDYVFIFKWHPGVFQNLKNDKLEFNFDQYKDFYYDLSDNRDINDLLLVTDVLVTDYSSVIFDYSLLNKPVVYFNYDFEEYEQDRGLYFPFEDYVYGEISLNCDLLIEAIKKENLMPEKRKRFMEKFMIACDGNSTKKTYELIFEQKDNK